MNKLLVERDENLDDIEYYLSEFYEYNKTYKKKINEIDLDKNKNTFQKLFSKEKLYIEYKKNEKYFDGIFEDFKDLKKSNLLFYIGAQQELFPINKDNDEKYVMIFATFDYYYLYDKNHTARVLRSSKFGMEKERVKIKNEINAHSSFEFINIFNKKINTVDLKNYVDDMIEENDPETWDELRELIIQDLVENKDTSKEKENASNIKENITNQNTTYSKEKKSSPNETNGVTNEKENVLTKKEETLEF